MKQERIDELYKLCSAEITKQTQEIHQLVQGTGSVSADVMFIGEYPTSEEEGASLPFVGKSGKPLNELIRRLELNREDTYTTHLLKYRPYKINEKSGRITNRAPKNEEISLFVPFLLEEIDIVAPKLIVAMGNLPMRVLLEEPELEIEYEHGRVRTRYINGRAYKILPFKNAPLSEGQEERNNLETIKKLIDFISQQEKPSEIIEEMEIEEIQEIQELEEKPSVQKANKNKAREIYTEEAGYNEVQYEETQEYSDAEQDEETGLYLEEERDEEEITIEEEPFFENPPYMEKAYNELLEKAEPAKEKPVSPAQRLREKLISGKKPSPQEAPQKQQEPSLQATPVAQATQTQKATKASQASPVTKTQKAAPTQSPSATQSPQKTVKPINSVPKPPLQSKKPANGRLKAIIIYGGDGYMDDPTLVAIDRISNVLTELSANIIRMDLFRNEYDIQGFFKELEDTHAVVIATTVEWLGIGGHLQLFLDKCWKLGNKEYFNNVYLYGVVISKQHYERDAYNHLLKSWELLGGVEGTSLCASIKKSVDLETNSQLLNGIDKKTEEFYRIAHQNRGTFPTSIRNNKLYMEVPTLDHEKSHLASKQDSNIAEPSLQDDLIPNYEEYVEKQQKDIADIANLFKKKINSIEANPFKTEPDMFKAAFIGGEDIPKTIIQWSINDRASKNFVMDVRGDRFNAYYGNIIDYNTIVHLDDVILERITEGKLSIQRAFMTGEIKAKGDFNILYKLDGLFAFK